MKQRRRTPRPSPTKPVRLDRKEVRRLATLARSFLPKGADKTRGRRITNGEAITVLAPLIGAEGGKVFGTWSELSIRTIALVLADVDNREMLIRATKLWAAVEKIMGSQRMKLRSQTACGLQ